MGDFYAHYKLSFIHHSKVDMGSSVCCAATFLLVNFSLFLGSTARDNGCICQLWHFQMQYRISDHSHSKSEKQIKIKRNEMRTPFIYQYSMSCTLILGYLLVQSQVCIFYVHTNPPLVDFKKGGPAASLFNRPSELTCHTNIISTDLQN